jgi:hypothetical protein
MSNETQTAGSSAIDAILTANGISKQDIIDAINAGKSTSTTKKAPKSGTYVSTQTSARVPDDTALTDKLNNAFQKYYGRDASQDEIDTWLPQLRDQYKSPDGKSKTVVKSTYKNGQLISTDYLTSEGEDPEVWATNQIKNQVLTGNLPVNNLNIPEGPAGKYFIALKNFAGNNGIRLSDETATTYAKQIVAGAVDENTILGALRESAATAFPSLSEKIKNGIDLKSLADPYIQSMSDILEIPSSSVDLFDPHIRSALSYTMPDGSVGTKSIYDFERELRKDPRWQYTEKARKEVAGATMQVLRDFGLQG